MKILKPKTLKIDPILDDVLENAEDFYVDVLMRHARAAWRFDHMGDLDDDEKRKVIDEMMNLSRELKKLREGREVLETRMARLAVENEHGMCK